MQGMSEGQSKHYLIVLSVTPIEDPTKSQEINGIMFLLILVKRKYVTIVKGKIELHLSH